MIKDQKVVVVMPAYNAARTLEKTHKEVLEQDMVDLIILVDDDSTDQTTALAQTLDNTEVHTHKPVTGWPWRRGPT